MLLVGAPPAERTARIDQVNRNAQPRTDKMRTLRSFAVTWSSLAFVLFAGAALRAAAPLEVGFAAVDITPNLEGDEPIYLAGLEQNRRATGIRDKLYARAVAMRDGKQTIAIVCVDSIGLQRHTIEAIRRNDQLQGINYVLVSSTHTHAAPDCIGLWGPSEGESGVSPKYMAQVEEGVVRAVREAVAALAPAEAFYGTATDESLLGDFRLPKVYDGVLRAIRFERPSDHEPAGILVQWNAHGIEPSKNPLVSRDFMGVVADELARRHHCPVVYVSGAVGGLMGTPSGHKMFVVDGKPIKDAFQAIDIYGRAITDHADRAVASAEAIELTPFVVAATPVGIPLDNEGYRMARAAGVLRRPAFQYSGDKYRLGDAVPAVQTDGPIAMETEVAYLRLGDLHVAAIPGELYPELVYGQYQEPVDPGADYPTATVEKPVMQSLPGDKTLLIGLANDEVGYIIPKRQWDVVAPYCYGRDSAQYGERNSVGPETALILTEALADCVRMAERQE
jgi:hypothetical protein